VSVTTHHYTVELIATPANVPLSLTSGRISLNVSDWPHVQASLNLGPVNMATYDALDPRLAPRVQITATAGTTTRVFNLGVRSRPVQWRDRDISLTLASDEALLDDYAPLYDDTALAAETSIRAIVNHVLDVVIPGASLEAGADYTVPLDAADEARIWRAGISAITFLRDLLQTLGLRLVCNEEREWTLRNEEYAESGVVVIRHKVNMVDASETLSRDNGYWFDAATIRHKWTNSSGDPMEAADSFALTSPHTRLRLFERDTPYPGAGFAEYAVRRAQGKGREVSATAVADWRARAEQWVEIVLPGTIDQTGKIQSVEFNLDSDEMTVTTITVDTPDSAWISVDLDEAWLDSPIGADWISEAV
jgi:hypothetical protein